MVIGNPLSVVRAFMANRKEAGFYAAILFGAISGAFNEQEFP
ncbi:MAG: hypothetical protein OXU66_08770 [Gammaproteobacteria bacterium]|nr:hypothetical protein [Gammaproteobacteria bacterium]